LSRAEGRISKEMSHASARPTGTKTARQADALHAGEKDLADGMLFDGMHHFVKVVVLRDKNLAADAKRTIEARTWEQAVATIELRAAVDARDNYAARAALTKLYPYLQAPTLPDDVKALLGRLAGTRLASIAERVGRERLSAKIHYDESAHTLAAAEFTKHMTQTRLVLWVKIVPFDHWKPGKRRERLEPGILCPDLDTALYVRAALRDLRVCPCDDNPFLPERPDQIYCSTRCRETFHKRRQRSRIAKPKISKSRRKAVNR